MIDSRCTQPFDTIGFVFPLIIGFIDIDTFVPPRAVRNWEFRLSGTFSFFWL
jgi:hypothetical protein